MVESPAVLGTGACLNVAYGATMPKIIEKGTPMSQVMIVVEFETKPEHRSQFIDLMRGHAERSRRDDGCLQFDLMLPKDDDKHVFLVEKWRDQEGRDAHAKGPMPGKTYKDWSGGRNAGGRRYWHDFSEPKFPASWNIQVILFAGAPRARFTSQFPTHRNKEFIWAHQGIKSPDQRIP